MDTTAKPHEFKVAIDVLAILALPRSFENTKVIESISDATKKNYIFNTAISSALGSKLVRESESISVTRGQEAKAARRLATLRQASNAELDISSRRAELEGASTALPQFLEITAAARERNVELRKLRAVCDSLVMEANSDYVSITSELQASLTTIRLVLDATFLAVLQEMEQAMPAVCQYPPAFSVESNMKVLSKITAAPANSSPVCLL